LFISFKKTFTARNPIPLQPRRDFWEFPVSSLPFPPNENLLCWDGLPKVTMDVGDVSTVTLCINALTFSSYFRSNVAQAGKKDGYSEDEICHEERRN